MPQLLDSLQTIEDRLITRLHRIPVIAGLNFSEQGARTLFTKLHATFGRDLLVKTPESLTAIEKTHVDAALKSYAQEIEKYFYRLSVLLKEQTTNTFADFKNNLKILHNTISDSTRPSRITASDEKAAGILNNSDDFWDHCMRFDGFVDGPVAGSVAANHGGSNTPRSPLYDADLATAFTVGFISQVQVEVPKAAIAAIYGFALVPNLLVRAYHAVDHIYQGYRVNLSIARLTALAAGMGGGYAASNYMPFGGPTTGATLALISGWGFTRITNDIANQQNRDTFGQRNPEKYMLTDQAITTLENNLTHDGKPTSRLKIIEGMQELEEAIKREKQESMRTQSRGRGFMYRLWGVPYTRTDRHQHMLDALRALQAEDIAKFKTELHAAGLNLDRMFTLPAPALRPGQTGTRAA